MSEPTFRKTGEAAVSESPLHARRKSRRIMVGPVPVGGGAPISVQSMTNTKTSDVGATLQQIAELTAAGCDIGAESGGCRCVAEDRGEIADSGDRRHPLPEQVRVRGDRRRLRGSAREPGQHSQIRRGGSADLQGGHRRRHLAAHRGQRRFARQGALRQVRRPHA